MGWDFYCDPSKNRDYLVKQMRAGADMSWDGHQAKVLDIAVRSNRVWRVIEQPNGERFIAVDLLRSGGRGQGWGSKSLCESMGPCEVDCPPRFFDLVPEPAGHYGAAWREEVRAYWAKAAARAKAKLEPGMDVVVYGKPYQIVRKAAKRGWIVRNPEGAIFRAIGGIEIQAKAEAAHG